MVEGISSKALYVGWMPPTDDGGQQVRYRIEVVNLGVSAMTSSTSVRLRDNCFMANTTYKYVEITDYRIVNHIMK